MQGGIRLAKHAGSWYEKQSKRQFDLEDKLNKQLESYLSKAQTTMKNLRKVKAIIGPHAGFTYSGPTAAWAYKYLQFQNSKLGIKINRIFLLGPSHKKYIDGCSVSVCDSLETPLGNLPVDVQQIKVLKNKAQFALMTKKDEQNQHSLEMHLPYIYKIFGTSAKIIPIIVGVTTTKSAAQYGKLFAPYLDEQGTIFIVSSDFCHWGQHFDYQPYSKDVPIHKHVEQLDRAGMTLIQNNDIKGFHSYMNETKNTICGEHPIRILLNTIKESKLGLKTKFVKYDQSERLQKMNGSSVSYASSLSFVEME